MIPISIDQIRLEWRDHKSAIWWLGLLYRHPVRFYEAFKTFSLQNGVGAALLLWLHALPYIVLLCLLGRFVVFGLLDFPHTDPLLTEPLNAFLFHAFEITAGIAGGIAIGIVTGIATGITREIAIGIAKGLATGIAVGIASGITAGIEGGILIVGIAVGIAFGIAGGITTGVAMGIAARFMRHAAGGIAGGIIFGIVFGIGVGINKETSLGIPFGIALGAAFGITSWISLRATEEISFGIAFGLAIGIAEGIAQGIAEGIAIGIAFGMAFLLCTLRIYYLPIHPLYFWPKVHGRWYPWHPVAWDDMCAIPFPELDRLLVAYAEYAPTASANEIERLINKYPRQRRLALQAKVLLLIREAGQVKNLTQLNSIVAQMPEGEKGFLGESKRVREMMQKISNFQTKLDTINRAILQEPLAQLLCNEIEFTLQEVNGFHESLESAFRAAATQWMDIAQRQLQEARAILAKEPIPQIFRAGDPVDREQEAFVLRDGVVNDLEKMLSIGGSGILLYGRRRVGKSTFLRNLSVSLPNTIAPVVISMLDPRVFTSIESFVGYIIQNVECALHGKKHGNGTPADLTVLFRYLSNYNTWLDKEGKHLVLAIDEYENFDVKIGEKVFSVDLLATLRESIQSHRCVNWIFAGSHDITELAHARWTSYLVSARTIEVPMFTLAETRLLLTEPLKFSSLWPKDTPGRPRFVPEFWSDGGIERIHKEAGGWPHLVQLIAETVIDLINEENTRQVNTDLMERALDKAIVRGHNVLYHLMRYESTLPGEWEYLVAFRKRETQPPPDDEAIYTSLRRRLLVDEENGEWRLRVPLMARWLKARG